jgi:hypothetical protein
MRYRIDDSGTVTRTNPNPHVTFYGQNLTDADVGGQRGSVVYINTVGPDGMIVVPVGPRNIAQRSITISENEPGSTAPRPRPPAGAGLNFAETM